MVDRLCNSYRAVISWHQAPVTPLAENYSWRHHAEGLVWKFMDNMLHYTLAHDWLHPFILHSMLPMLYGW